MKIEIPEFALVLLVGASGTGKSSFAARHFRPTEVISSDAMRGWVCDDESDQAATPDAFAMLHALARTRLRNRRLTVIDATNVQPAARKSLVALAREAHALVVAIVFDLPEAVAVARNAGRADRAINAGVVSRQMRDLHRGLRGMRSEGIRYTHVLHTAAEVDAVTFTRTRLWTDRREDRGPFDIIGDVHGCADELQDLLQKLGYTITWQDKAVQVTPPAGRRAVFVGDLVDRGPNTPDVLRIVRAMVEAGHALAVVGNHDDKLKRYLSGKAVKRTHGLAETIEQLEAEPPAFVASLRPWLDGLISHYVLDEGRLVVAHAGIREDMQGRASGAVRAFCMYGETTGEIDSFGLPVRYDWAADYRGQAKVVYGHTPVMEAQWHNGTLCIDTGCCFGGRLTALRYPEMELVAVQARETYAEPLRPLGGPATPEAQPSATMPDVADVLGRQVVKTHDLGTIVIAPDNAAAALEVMSRFAVDPRWLIHLPPTMSPPETSAMEGWLERPEEALAYYRKNGVGSVVVEEKHMGSRALVVLARNPDVAARRFGVSDGARGIVVTRTGRRLFDDPAIEAAVLHQMDAAMTTAGLWDDLATDWVLWDVEAMPWNMKAAGLVHAQFAPVGAAAIASLSAAEQALAAARARGVAVDDLQATTAVRLEDAFRYRDAYNRYVTPFEGLASVRIAPFHLLASEGHVHADRDHAWHMQRAHRLAEAGGPLVMATRHRLVDLNDPEQCAAAIAWWEDLTKAGGEGMVVKPLDFLARGRRGLIQPAIKCRGRDYLRIIYGPDYDRPEHLVRLKKRNLGQKRSMAIREFALGLEALRRFVAHAPLSQVHQCVFGVLAMESEPVDSRL